VTHFVFRSFGLTLGPPSLLGFSSLFSVSPLVGCFVVCEGSFLIDSFKC